MPRSSRRPSTRLPICAAALALLVGCGPAEPNGASPARGAASSIPAAAVGAVGASFEGVPGSALGAPAPAPERAKPMDSPFGAPPVGAEEPEEDDEPLPEPKEPQGVQL